MSTYGFCENKCKHEVYTKEEVNNALGGKSDTSHNHDDRYYTETEMDTKLANCKLKGDFAILNGDIISDGTNYTASTTINYPQGFNNTNCVVLSVMLELENDTVLWGYGETHNSGSFVSGSLSKRVALRSSDISLEIRHIYMLGNDSQNGTITNIMDNLTANTFHYKIVLMKI